MADVYGDPAAADSGFAGLLDDPRARAALLQIGINLMQPQYGQSALGAIGGAIGAGGEAVGRIDEATRKDEEAQSKLAQREGALSNMQGKLDATAQQNAIRQQRADSEQAAREGRLNLGQQSLELNQKRAEDQNRRFGLSQAFRERDAEAKRDATKNKAQEDFLAKESAFMLRKVKEEQDRVDAANALKSSREPKEQFNPALEPYKGVRTPLEARDIMKNDPIYQERFLRQFGGTAQTPAQPRVMSPGGAQPISGTVEDSGTTSYPSAPQDARMRSVGQVYQTPQGPMEWKGNGWLPLNSL